MSWSQREVPGSRATRRNLDWPECPPHQISPGTRLGYLGGTQLGYLGGTQLG
jgi:hypothetical protein